MVIGLLALALRPSGNGIRYTTEPARRGDLTVLVTATGTLQPTNQVDVGSELSGTIRTVSADFNDTVKVGQELAKLDTTKLDSQVLQSRAALESARARVEQAKASLAEAESQIARFVHVRELSGGKVPSQADFDSANAVAAARARRPGEQQGRGDPGAGDARRPAHRPVEGVDQVAHQRHRAGARGRARRDRWPRRCRRPCCSRWPRT